MPNWLATVLLIVVIAAVALFRESRRVRRVEDWIAATGFRRIDTSDTAWQATGASLVTRMHDSGARIWGMAIAGALDGTEVTIAEHESSRGINNAPRWYTLVMWRLRQPAAGPIVIAEAQDSRLAAAAEAVATLGTGVRVSEQLGITEPVPEEARPLRVDAFELFGEPTLRDAWLTPARREALNGLPTEARFVCDGAYAGWRFEGTVTPESLEQVRARFQAVRRVFE